MERTENTPSKDKSPSYSPSPGTNNGGKEEWTWTLEADDPKLPSVSAGGQSVALGHLHNLLSTVFLLHHTGRVITHITMLL